MTRQVEDILALRERWLAAQPLPEPNSEALWRWLRVSFNYHSNKIEGSSLSRNDTQMLLVHGTVQSKRPMRDYHEMKGHNAAFEHIRQLAEKKRLINEQDIKDLNRLCLGKPFYKPAKRAGGKKQIKIIPGEYKTTLNYVLLSEGSRHYFALPEKTPGLMKELIRHTTAWLGKKEDDKLNAIIPFLADFHMRFVRIHPFTDGNGRAVRLLMNYILIRHGFLPLAISDRKEYLNAVQMAHKDKNELLETLIEKDMRHMLERGIRASKRIITLNGGKGLGL